MPSVEWANPKDWLEGEKLKADEFDEQLTNNLIWLFEKNYDVVQVSGVSDYQTSSLTPVAVGVLTLQINKVADETVLRFGGTWSMYSNTGSAFTYFDVRMDNSIYLSTGTTSPAAAGLLRYQQDTATIGTQISLEAWIDNVDAGYHTFELVWWVGSGISTINVTNTIAQFSVEEYGVADIVTV